MAVIFDGEKLHIIEKRNFEKQPRRHFIGQVIDVDDHAVRMKGYTWIFEPSQDRFVRRPGVRTRIMYFDSGVIVNVMPQNVDIDAIVYVKSESGVRRITDRDKYGLDLAELEESQK